MHPQPVQSTVSAKVSGLQVRVSPAALDLNLFYVTSSRLEVNEKQIKTIVAAGLNVQCRELTADVAKADVSPFLNK